MKLIIAGSRWIMHIDPVTRGLMASPFVITEIEEIVSGMAPGVDMTGVLIAEVLKIPVHKMPAQWLDRDGIKDPQAGFRRNVQMAKYVGPTGGLLAIDGGTSGTRHMIRTARAKGLMVYVHKVER